jgi:hypothetical protein
MPTVTAMSFMMTKVQKPLQTVATITPTHCHLRSSVPPPLMRPSSPPPRHALVREHADEDAAHDAGRPLERGDIEDVVEAQFLLKQPDAAEGGEPSDDSDDEGRPGRDEP